jgi:hypothetical protein
MTFIVVFVAFLFFRVLGLMSHSTETSNLAFDILACGACILFPRLAFFAIKDNVVILAVSHPRRGRTDHPAQGDDC